MPSSSEAGFRRRRCFPVVLSLLLPALFLLGCANPGQKRLDAFRTRLSQGDLAGSLEKVRASKALYGENSAFLHAMDLGVLHHYLGAWDSSIAHLARAEQIADDLYARSVTNEAAALAVNDNMRPFRPREYERILLAQFQLVNYLAKGDLQGALVETRRGVLLLDKLAERDEGKYREDGALEYLHSLVFRAAGERDNSLISLRRSLIAYSRGKVPMPDLVRQDATLRLRRDARGKVFEERGITPAANLETVRALDTAAAEIAVLTYRGRTPELGQIRAWGEWIQGGLFAWHWSNPETGKEVTDAIPAPPMPGGVSGKTFHVNFTLPVRKDVPSRVATVEVVTPHGGVLRPAPLSDTRILLDQSLEESHAATVARTIVRVAARTVAAQKVKSAVKTGNPLLDLLANVGMDLAQGEIEQSDLRQCIWLPREIGLVRIPATPGVQALTARGMDGSGGRVQERVFGDASVAPGEVRFLVAALPW